MEEAVSVDSCSDYPYMILSIPQTLLFCFVVVSCVMWDCGVAGMHFLCCPGGVGSYSKDLDVGLRCVLRESIGLWNIWEGLAVTFEAFVMFLTCFVGSWETCFTFWDVVGVLYG